MSVVNFKSLTSPMWMILIVRWRQNVTSNFRVYDQRPVVVDAYLPRLNSKLSDRHIKILSFGRIKLAKLYISLLLSRCESVLLLLVILFVAMWNTWISFYFISFNLYDDRLASKIRPLSVQSEFKLAFCHACFWNSATINKVTKYVINFIVSFSLMLVFSNFKFKSSRL